MIRERNDRIGQAWLTAYLGRVPAKKFPKLDKLLVRNRISQTPDEMLNAAKQWTLALGGTIRSKPKDKIK